MTKSKANPAARAATAVPVKRSKPKPVPVQMTVAQPAQKSERPAKGLLSTVGSLGGDAISAATGIPALGWVGGKLGDAIGHLIGFGDYKVVSNSLVGNAQMQAPKFGKTSAKGGIRVQHREFVMNVNATEEFTTTELPLNAGMLQTFPWLSSVAQRFECYRFRGLVFHYVPTSGQVTAVSPALGAVMLGTQYDVLDEPFTSKREMDAYEYTTSAAPFNTFMHPVECDLSTRPTEWLYVRPGTVEGDLRFYDMGVTIAASEGAPSTYVGGELWVTYDVEFDKPKLPSGAPGSGGAFRSIVRDGTQGQPMGMSDADFVITYDTLSTPEAPLVTRVDPTNMRVTRAGAYVFAMTFFQSNGSFTSSPSFAGVGTNIVANTLDAIASNSALGIITGVIDVLVDGTGPANGITITGSAITGTGPLLTKIELFPITDDLYEQEVTNAQAPPLSSLGHRRKVERGTRQERHRRKTDTPLSRMLLSGVSQDIGDIEDLGDEFFQKEPEVAPVARSKPLGQIRK